MDASDVRRQTADEADRVGGGGERGGLWGVSVHLGKPHISFTLKSD